MPPRKRKTVEQCNTVTLTVNEGFSLPEWYAQATPEATGRALLMGAALMDGAPPSVEAQIEVKAAVAHVREDAVVQREKLLAVHEAQLESIIADKNTALEAQRAAMQTEIDALTSKNTEAGARAKRLVEENDGLQEKIDQFEAQAAAPGDPAPVKEHFESLATHTGELLASLADHHSLIDRLGESSVNLRAKIFVFYRRCKSLNLDIPWLDAAMQLPWEAAYEHACARPWNNVTASKAKEVEAGLSKAAALLAMKEEPT